TVSRVLRNKGEISDETRAKVLECAQKFNYRPNLLIQGIQTGRSGNIGIMVPPYDGHWARVIEGIHDTLVEHDYAGIMLWEEYRHVQSKEKKEAFMLQQMHRLIDRRVDGVILWPRVSEVYGAHLDDLKSRNLPVVTIDHDLDFSDSVVTDERLGAELVARHLYKLGHRRIAHLAGHQEWTWAKLRRRYFEEAVKAYPDTAFILQIGSDIEEEIEEPIRRLLEKKPTAVFAFGDWVAFEIYKVAADMGLGIPKDLSVVGYSDSTKLSQIINPSLTTVRQKSRQIGIEAVTLLMDRLDGKEKSSKRVRTVVDCELIVRNSTQSL
ncbi:MAG TPA: LacI family DNA-binding transcriptional regulator, partial [Anaerohalosphaeraceae bacterium]|nr:LacI family DNA-binding transcriptional regulator [Anaerohalosphaeraceae bacterium]